MLAWHLWLIAALVLLLAELLGTGFFAFAMGLAALVAMAAALLGAGATGQWFAFAVATAVLAPLLAWISAHLAEELALPEGLAPALVLLVLVGCGDAGPTPEEQVRTTVSEFGQATAAKDYKAMCGRLLAPDLIADVERYALTVVGYTGNNILPARAGDAVRVLLMAPRAQTSRRLMEAERLG